MEDNLMSPISHEEARRLINFNADQPLDAKTGFVLDIHLNGCMECRRYASELNELENLLRKMKPGLNLRPAPLHLDQIMHQSKGTAFGFLNNVLVTRITTITAAFITVAIVTWQILSASSASPVIPYTAIPVPTPSTYFITSTNTDIMLLNCDYVPYQTQAGDTMDSIALQFSVSKETIMDFNEMKEEEIKPSMQIRIPTCSRTPTVTSEILNSTITITPQFEPITLTPG
jgi:LysM repeat protein